MSEPPVAFLIVVYGLVFLGSLALPWIAIAVMLRWRHRRRAEFPIGSRWTFRGETGEIYFVAIGPSELIFMMDSGKSVSVDLAYFQATATRVLPEVSRGG